VLFFMISIFSLPALSRKDKSQKGIKWEIHQIK
jgi:hypothetical protein